jgi:alanine dehydrogenase
VLIPGAKAPRLITRRLLGTMERGSAFVDVAVDQGGCAETTHPTTHRDPRYIDEGVVHYCVANMPGAVPQTSTYALTNVTLGYALEIADKGWKRAATENKALAAGANIALGHVTHNAVAEAHALPWTPIDRV